MKLSRMMRRIATSLMNYIFTWMEWEEAQVREQWIREDKEIV